MCKLIVASRSTEGVSQYEQPKDYQSKSSFVRGSVGVVPRLHVEFFDDVEAIVKLVMKKMSWLSPRHRRSS